LKGENEENIENRDKLMKRKGGKRKDRLKRGRIKEVKGGTKEE
jgi:hypothetical protein